MNTSSSSEWEKEMEEIVRQFKALSDETRLRILHLLLCGELCICHLVDVLDLPQSTISRHMAYLKNAGLVTDRRESVWIYYSLAKPRNKIHGYQLKCLSECFEGHEILKRDSVRLEALEARRQVKVSAPSATAH
jgi:ArsR family transcriptional regulator